jgi:hypothetical protein
MTKKPKPKIDFGYPTEAQGKIPSFASIEEEAEFWDTHDTTDLLDDWEPVELSVSEQFRETLTLRLAAADRDTLAQIAEREGVEPAELARKWVTEHLREAVAKVS